MTLLMEGQAPRAGSRRIGTHITLVAVVLACICATRLLALNYNSASADEALYLSAGQSLIGHGVMPVAIQETGGTLLYPFISALAAQVGVSGLHGARALAAFATLGAAFNVYWFARRVFDPAVAIFALIIFGFTGISVFTGTQAVADSFGVALLSGTVTLLAVALTSQRSGAVMAAMCGAAACFTLAVLCVYDVAIWGIVVLMLWIGLLTRREWLRLQLLSFGFAIPVALGLGLYTVLHGGITLNINDAAQQSSGLWEVLRQLSYALRLPFVLALFCLGYDLITRRTTEPHVGLLWAAALILPLFCLVNVGKQPLPHKLTYTLIFLAPLAGQGIQRMLDLTPRDGIRQAITLGLSVVSMLITFQVWNDQTWLLQRAWPNSQPTVAFLRSLPVSPTTRVLAENASIYDYYLGWNSTQELTSVTEPGFSYRGQQGSAALAAALDDHYFDYVILDGYAAPELSAQVSITAQRAGYQAVFQDVEIVPGVREQTFTLMVYHLPH